MSHIRPAVLAAIVLFGATCGSPPRAGAQDKPPTPTMDLPQLVRALQGGGYIIYFRHAATEHNKPDAERIDFENCATQRNLSAQGREQAQAIGKAFAALGIKISTVLSSPYCRCIETAKLAFGKASVLHDLEFAMAKSENEAKRLGAVLRKHLAAKPRPGTNAVIVAHSANLKEAVGIWPQPEGAAYVFQPQGDTGKFVARVAPDEWPQLARAK